MHNAKIVEQMMLDKTNRKTYLSERENILLTVLIP